MSQQATVRTSEQENEQAPTTETSTGESCPECSGRLEADPARGERSCVDCGLVVEEGEIDHGPEWRAFGDGGSTIASQRSRVGAPQTQLRHDTGLGTTVPYSPGDREHNRRRVQHARALRDGYRHDIYGLKEVNRIAAALGLAHSLREQVGRFFRFAQDHSLARGRSTDALAGACVYIVCRQNGLSRTMNEVLVTTRTDLGLLEKTYDALRRIDGVAVPPPLASEYVGRFASELDLPREHRQRARSLVKLYETERDTSGLNPAGIAAGACYLAALDGAYRTQSTVAERAGVVEPTLRRRYYELCELDPETATPPESSLPQSVSS
jgi:transcription initiation factor TFIIB